MNGILQAQAFGFQLQPTQQTENVWLNIEMVLLI